MGSTVDHSQHDGQKASDVIRADYVYNLSAKLSRDEQFKLAARLWVELRSEERASLNAPQLDRSSAVFPKPDPFDNLPASRVVPFDKIIRECLFDPAKTSELYSVPRCLDLATIFAVTAAYSIFLGIMSAFGAWPSVKIILCAVVTIVGVCQALFLNKVNPRGVSILAGAIAYTLLCFVAWRTSGNDEPGIFFVIVLVNGVFGGVILGYLSGVLVGGVFLIADKLRKRFAREPAEAADTYESSII